MVQRRAPIYDKAQDGHYNLISALHKSVRGSDPDAALYYLCRMLDAGEDPLYLARRVVRMAVEDIGLADPQALVICQCRQGRLRLPRLARRRTGDRPGGDLCRDRAEIERRLYGLSARPCAPPRRRGSLLPPKHILNAPTKLMKAEGYGAGYEYDHDAPEAFSGQDYFPEALGRQTILRPARARLRARDQEAAGVLGEAAERAGRQVRRIALRGTSADRRQLGGTTARAAEPSDGRGPPTHRACASEQGRFADRRHLAALRSGRSRRRCSWQSSSS